MLKNLDDLYKKIDQSNKELSKQNNEISKDITDLNKDNEKALKEINEIKKQIKEISIKVDMMLEILNNFTIMLAEDDEDLEEHYDIEDSEESWVPKEDNFFDNDENDLI